MNKVLHFLLSVCKGIKEFYGLGNPGYMRKPRLKSVISSPLQLMYMNKSLGIFIMNTTCKICQALKYLMGRNCE